MRLPSIKGSESNRLLPMSFHFRDISVLDTAHPELESNVVPLQATTKPYSPGMPITSSWRFFWLHRRTRTLSDFEGLALRAWR